MNSFEEMHGMDAWRGHSVPWLGVAAMMGTACRSAGARAAAPPVLTVTSWEGVQYWMLLYVWMFDSFFVCHGQHCSCLMHRDPAVGAAGCHTRLLYA